MISGHSTISLFALLLTFSAIGALAQSGGRASEVYDTEDMQRVIQMAGFPCTAITNLAKTTPSIFKVNCSVGQRYEIDVSEESIQVRSLTAIAPAAPAETSRHAKIMKTQFAAIVNLSGHECAGVVTWEHLENAGDRVTCSDDTVYIISVKPEGRVEVRKESASP